MKILIGKIAHFTGIDGSIRNLLVGRIWSIFAGPVTVILIAKFLGKSEQGFYYTFFSVQGLQMFFELGVSFVIMQFASHEASGLEWSARGTLEGDLRRKSRLASLLKIAVKWYGIAGFVCMSGLIVGGTWFFRTSEDSQNVNWLLPWLLTATATGVNLFLIPLYSILEGCGKIREMYGILAWQNIISSIILWLALMSGAGLYCAPIPLLVSMLFMGSILISRYRKFFLDLWHHQSALVDRVSWRHELFPLQWKLAMSTASGYFIFQLINPVIFRYHGAAAAGQFGMTQRLVDSVQGLSFAWVSAKASIFGNLLSQNNHSELLKLFRRSFWQSVAAATLGSGAMVTLLFSLGAMHMPIAERFLSPLAAIYLCFSMIANVAIFAIATLVRSGKKEPFLIPSLLGAIIVPMIVFTVGVQGGTTPLAMGLALTNLLFGLPIAIWIFHSFRRSATRVERPSQ